MIEWTKSTSRYFISHLSDKQISEKWKIGCIYFIEGTYKFASMVIYKIYRLQNIRHDIQKTIYCLFN